MKTCVTRSPAAAARILCEGGVVAFPTETVYGLGADALNAAAVKKIFRAKGRPADNPLIVHVADVALLARVARRIPPAAKKLMASFFPGPLTVIVPRHPDLPREATAGLDTVGVRIPDHPVAQAFLRACGTPVAAPSANRSGRPSPTTWTAVRDEMDGRIPCILQGGRARVGLESTVVDCTSARPLVLRVGAVTVEALRKVVPGLRVATHTEGPVKSPGLKYRHYAPASRVVLVDDPAQISAAPGVRFAYIGLTARGLRPRPVLTSRCREVPAYARALFHFFRQCEAEKVDVIFCQRVAASGLGRALMDRLEKAAAGRPTVSSGANTTRG